MRGTIFFRWILSGVIGVALFLLPQAITYAEESGKIVIFHAGSLTIPLAKMEKQFETKHPDVDVLREAAGSQKCARKITDLKKPCDIMASADYKVIDKLLIPNHADWNIRFATNQLVLCYTDKSKYIGEVNDTNWYDIIAHKGVIWGHSDPNLDPCGYRALMVLQLAEKYYKEYPAQISGIGFSFADRKYGLCLGVSFCGGTAWLKIHPFSRRDQPGKLPVR